MHSLREVQEAGAIVIGDLAKQQQEYNRQRSELDAAIERFNAYILENEMLRQALEAHCMSNQNVAKNLPHGTEIDRVLASVRMELERVDRLLVQARQDHENKFLRAPITF